MDTLSDKIGNLRKNRNYREAWTDLLTELLDDSSCNAACHPHVWMDHITGRYCDEFEIPLKSLREPAFLFWAYAHENISNGRTSELFAHIEQYQDELIARAQSLWETEAPETVDSICSLMEGCFAATKTAIAVRLNTTTNTTTTASLPDTLRPPHQEFTAAVRCYHRFWTSTKGPFSFSLERIDCNQQLDQKSRAKQWMIDAQLQASKERSHQTPVAMVARAVRWLLGLDPDHISSLLPEPNIWVFFSPKNEHGVGTAARLRLVKDEESLPALSYPDPIHLGCAIDSEWGKSFDTAVSYVKTQPMPTAPISFRWDIQFLNGKDAKNIWPLRKASASRDTLTANSLRRPLGLTGPSAAPAFALILRKLCFSKDFQEQCLRFSTTGLLEIDGTIGPVEIASKLHERLWNFFDREPDRPCRLYLSCVNYDSWPDHNRVAAASSVEELVRITHSSFAQDSVSQLVDGSGSRVRDSLLLFNAFPVIFANKLRCFSGKVFFIVALTTGLVGFLYLQNSGTYAYSIPLRLLRGMQMNDSAYVSILSSDNPVELFSLSDKEIKKLESVTGPVREIRKSVYFTATIPTESQNSTITLPYLLDDKAWSVWLRIRGSEHFELYNRFRPVNIAPDDPVEEIVVQFYEPKFEPGSFQPQIEVSR